MPTIAVATCFLLVITWASPLPVYAGEIQGVVWIDGEAQFLHLERAYPEAVWTAALQPGQWIVDYAYVALTVQPETAEVSNTPFAIQCNQIWLPNISK